MTPPERPPQRLLRAAAAAGMLASALAVFTSGWFAMRATDWRRMVLATLCGLVAAALASAFSRRLR